MLGLPFSFLALSADVMSGAAAPGDHSVMTMKTLSQHTKDGRGEGRKKWGLWWHQ